MKRAELPVEVQEIIEGKHASATVKAWLRQAYEAGEAKGYQTGYLHGAVDSVSDVDFD